MIEGSFEGMMKDIDGSQNLVAQIILIYCKSNSSYDYQLEGIQKRSWEKKKKEVLIFLVMAPLIEKRSLPLIKVKENIPQRVLNLYNSDCCVFVIHQIFFKSK